MPFATLAIDPATGHVDLSTGSPRLVTDVGATVECAKQRLRLHREEWELDVRAGMPWADIIASGLHEVLKDAVERMLLTVPGIASVREVGVQELGGRRLAVRPVCVALDGEAFSFVFDTGEAVI